MIYPYTLPIPCIALDWRGGKGVLDLYALLAEGRDCAADAAQPAGEQLSAAVAERAGAAGGGERGEGRAVRGVG